MSSVALEPVRECLSQWREEQARCATEITDSFQALEAFQRSLESWQANLAAERDALQHERETLTQERSNALATHDLAHDAELEECRQRIGQLEQQLTHKQQELSQQNEHWSAQFQLVLQQLEQNQPAPAAPAEQEPDDLPRNHDPVLGSVVAQFGKLRKQRAERGVR